MYIQQQTQPVSHVLALDFTLHAVAAMKGVWPSRFLSLISFSSTGQHSGKEVNSSTHTAASMGGVSPLRRSSGDQEGESERNIHVIG